MCGAGEVRSSRRRRRCRCVGGAAVRAQVACLLAVHEAYDARGAGGARCAFCRRRSPRVMDELLCGCVCDALRRWPSVAAGVAAASAGAAFAGGSRERHSGRRARAMMHLRVRPRQAHTRAACRAPTRAPWRMCRAPQPHAPEPYSRAAPAYSSRTPRERSFKSRYTPRPPPAAPAPASRNVRRRLLCLCARSHTPPHRSLAARPADRSFHTGVRAGQDTRPGTLAACRAPRLPTPRASAAGSASALASPLFRTRPQQLSAGASLAP
jgi:hypothetical protein